MKLNDLDKKNIWHPFTQHIDSPHHICIEKGKGASIFDIDGNEYIDAVSSWWVNLHGHSNPYINKKISEQLEKIEHTIFAGFTHPSAIELCERLLNILPNNQKKCFFSDNGSTAVEVALKMTFQYWHNINQVKTKVIAFENSYHGDTFGSMSVSDRSPFTEPFFPFLFDVEYIPTPNNENWEECFGSFKNLVDTNEVAAFIFEPLVQGAGGMVMYEAHFLEKMVAYCKKNEVFCIADEVMTGFGRTGKHFASQYLQTAPDLFCLSKGLTGGYLPMSITTCTSQIFEAFLSNDKMKTFFHGHSYTANAVACSAALASMDLLLSEECTNQIKNINDQHLNQLPNFEKHPSVLKARVQGTILAIEIKTPSSTSYFNNIRDEIYNFCLKRNVLLRPLGNVLYILPPYCISDSQLNKVYEVMFELLGWLGRKTS